MLIFPLKKEWYEKIKSGEKTVEYREVKPYWTKRIANNYCRPMFALYFPDEVYKRVGLLGFEYHVNMYCIFQKGYTRKRLKAIITKIEVVDGKDTDLHIDKPVYAIHLDDVKEYKENEAGRN